MDTTIGSKVNKRTRTWAGKRTQRGQADGHTDTNGHTGNRQADTGNGQTERTHRGQANGQRGNKQTDTKGTGRRTHRTGDRRTDTQQANGHKRDRQTDTHGINGHTKDKQTDTQGTSKRTHAGQADGHTEDRQTITQGMGKRTHKGEANGRTGDRQTRGRTDTKGTKGCTGGQPNGHARDTWTHRGQASGHTHFLQSTCVGIPTLKFVRDSLPQGRESLLESSESCARRHWQGAVCVLAAAVTPANVLGTLKGSLVLASKKGTQPSV